MNAFDEGSFFELQDESYVENTEEQSFFEQIADMRKPRVSSLQMRRRIEDAEERKRMRELYDFEDFDF